MSDSRTKYEEMRFYFDEDLKPQQKINQTLTKNQAINVCNNLLLSCKVETEEILELIEYIRNR